MSDIFREVEEDVRRDRLEKLWKAYGTYVLALLAVVMVGVAGFEYWQHQQALQRDQDSTAFTAALRIANPKQAEAAFANLSKTTHGGYGTLSRLEQANLMSANGKTADAVAIYKQIGDADHGALGAVARLRAAWAEAETAPRADLQSELQPLLDPGSVWRQMAEEILAYADYHAGKTLVASSEFSKLAADPEATEALKNRARTFAAFLNAGGAVNYGTVPPPAPTPAPGAAVPGTPAP